MGASEGGPAAVAAVEEEEEAPWERRGGRGRKLQAEEGRWETRV